MLVGYVRCNLMSEALDVLILKDAIPGCCGMDYIDFRIYEEGGWV
jgi:hypothetical protein